MVITFCGHANYHRSKEDEERIISFLQETVGDQSADICLGEYGGFDCFAYDCCKKYKSTQPHVSLVFVTPYLTPEYMRNRLQHQKRYDQILYPEIEDKPKRYAIVYRNRYMVEKADFVIAYVSHDWGGAYTTYRYAKRMGKEILNLADFEIRKDKEEKGN